MEAEITYKTTVTMDGEERDYAATKKTLPLAKFHCEKKARAFLRRRGLSVKQDNVIKEVCPDCENKTLITVYDLEVPKRQSVDDLDWLIDRNWSL